MENERLRRILQDLKSGNLSTSATRLSSSTLHSANYSQAQQPSSGWDGGTDASGIPSMSGIGMSHGQAQYGYPRSSLHVDTQSYATHEQYGVPPSIQDPSHADGGYDFTLQLLELSGYDFGHRYGGMGNYGAQPGNSSSSPKMPLRSPSTPLAPEFDDGTRRKKVSILCPPVGTVLNQIRSIRGETLAISVFVLHVVGQIPQSGGRLVQLRSYAHKLFHLTDGGCLHHLGSHGSKDVMQRLRSTMGQTEQGLRAS
jgi:hypothetical protein